jgi:hypothetical protein
MEHVVFYQSTQGTPAFRRMASIEDAVSFAEHLRNVEGVTDFSVYALTPVSLKLRAYYHVEISETGRAMARPAPIEAVPVDTAVDTVAPADAAPTEAAAADAIAAETTTVETTTVETTSVETTSVETAEARQLPEPPPALPEPAATDRYAIPADAAKPEQSEAAGPAAPADFAGPAEPPTIPDMPFVAGPTATRFAAADAFVKDDPTEATAPELAPATDHPVIDHPVIDPSVVDPTVEEVVPVPPGRRSMGFFARS